MDEVAGDDLLVGVLEDALQVGFAGLLQGGLDLDQRGVPGRLEGEVDDGDGRNRDPEGHAGELALHFREHQRRGLGGARRRRDDVDRGGTPALPVLLRWTVDSLLGRRVGVHRGHEALLEAEALLEHDVDERHEAVGGAGGVGDNVVFGGVVLAVVHAHDDGDVLVLRRGGDDDLLGAGHDVAVGGLRVVLGGVGEQAGRLDHELHAQLGPGKLGRRLGADHEDVPAVDDEHIVLGLVGGRLLRADRAVETTLGGVVFEQVGQVVGRHDIADGDHIEGRAEQALLHEGAKDETADAAETVDCDFNCHGFLRFWFVG